MKAFTTLIVIALAMPLLALPPVPAALPPVVHVDMEVTTNVAISSWQYGAAKFTFSLSCLATPSNKVEAAFGRDCNANGELDPEETDLVVGWDRGAWFVQNGIGGVRSVVASESSNGIKTLVWSYRLTAARAPARLAVTADDVEVFETLSAESPAWLHDRNWDLMRLTGRGLENPSGAFMVGTPLNPTFIMFR